MNRELSLPMIQSRYYNLTQNLKYLFNIDKVLSLANTTDVEMKNILSSEESIEANMETITRVESMTGTRLGYLLHGGISKAENVTSRFNIISYHLCKAYAERTLVNTKPGHVYTEIVEVKRLNNTNSGNPRFQFITNMGRKFITEKDVDQNYTLSPTIFTKPVLAELILKPQTKTVVRRWMIYDTSENLMYR